MGVFALPILVLLAQAEEVAEQHLGVQGEAGELGDGGLGVETHPGRLRVQVRAGVLEGQRHRLGLQGTQFGFQGLLGLRG